VIRRIAAAVTITGHAGRLEEADDGMVGTDSKA
jgi:hypothetical protein